MFSARRQEPGADRRQRELEAVFGPRQPPGERVGARLRLGEALQRAPGRVGAHVLRRDPAGGERSNDRAGGGADDALRVDGAPAGLGLERVQRPDEPGSADHAPCPQDKTHTHGGTVPLDGLSSGTFGRNG